MRHFIYFENGGPFPGTCLSCGTTTELYHLDRDLLSGGVALLCKRCAVELAEFMGYAPIADTKRTIQELEETVESLQIKLNNIPNEVETLIDSIRNSVASFVLSISSKPKPDGDKTVPKSGKPVPKSSGDRKNPEQHSQTRIEPSSHERPDGVSAAVSSDRRGSDSV